MAGGGGVISSPNLIDRLEQRGVSFYTGVPCSYLGGPIAEATARGRYVPAANEGAALALAAGAVSAGRQALVFAQNSGFGNLINPLTSLIMPYQIPLLVLMSLRGWPDPDQDEPQHRVMGMTTHALLDSLGVRHWTLETAETDLDRVLDLALAELANDSPAFLLVRKGALSPPDSGKYRSTRPDRTATLSRAEGMRILLEDLPKSVIVSTTGYTSRDLFALNDGHRPFYMQGSMGHASAFALGVALNSAVDRPVLLLDGDGAALMHLGTMSTVGAAKPGNLVHVIFDNGSYESTGSQPTTADSVSFTAIATAAGYRSATECPTATDLHHGVRRAVATAGPHLLVVPTAPGMGAAPPRATSAISAPEIYRSFRAEVGAA